VVIDHIGLAKEGINGDFINNGATMLQEQPQ
jgi:hypothetical protein